MSLLFALVIVQPVSEATFHGLPGNVKKKSVKKINSPFHCFIHFQKFFKNNPHIHLALKYYFKNWLI